MPRFSDFVEYDVDVDPQDYVNMCNSSEIQELIEELIANGWIKKDARTGISKPDLAPSEFEFEEAITKLHGKWNMLSAEEENLILKIASRF